METGSGASEAQTSPQKSSLDAHPTSSRPRLGKKKAKGSGSGSAESKLPITLSFSIEFSRRLKVVVSALDESAGEYVESRLAAVLQKDLKRILEDLS